MASVTGQEVYYTQQYSIILRFSTTGSESTQASTIRPRRRLSGPLKLGVHFCETRSKPSCGILVARQDKPLYPFLCELPIDNVA